MSDINSTNQTNPTQESNNSVSHSGLAGQYDFKTNEKEILKYWEENGLYESPQTPSAFQAASQGKQFDRDEYWTLVCPPPNAYDRPHMGNLSGYTYMDMMARYQRMRGKKVIMLPGKDHAGLEGEAVFIRDQLTPQGKKKSDFTREEFYDLLYKQQQEFIRYIQQDEKLTGLSADFSKDLYTLDPKVVEKVLQTFVDSYNKGLIYKGTRIINWDPAAQSAVSDSQCEREERDGKLYFIKYELVESFEIPKRPYIDEFADGYYQGRHDRSKEILIKLLEFNNKNKLNLIIAGGWACLMNAGYEYRLCEDLDIYIFHEEEDIFVDFLKHEGFAIADLYNLNNKYFYQANKDDTPIDIHIIKSLDKEIIFLDDQESIGNLVNKEYFGINISILDVETLINDKLKERDNSEKELRWKELADFLTLGRKDLYIRYKNNVETAQSNIANNINIRKATYEDGKDMFHISVEGFEDNFVDESIGVTLNVIHNKLGMRFDNEEKIKEYSEMNVDPKHDFYVAEMKGQIVGWVSCEFMNELYCVDIYVKRGFRNQGIGQKLLNHILDEHQDKLLRLSVPQKSKAVEFYKRNGFIEYNKNKKADLENPKYPMMIEMRWTKKPYIEVATTRPETIFADTAVAVHPDDPRYKHLVGRKVKLPGLNREVPIITSKRVEMDFGTGCLKITPAHAQDDYTIMEEWNKENPDNKIGYINCIDKYAQLIGPVPEKYLGKKAKVVKEEFVTELAELGLLTKTEDIKQNILKSERTGAVIEQIISSQWFIKVDNLKEELKGLIESGNLTLHPYDAQNRLFAWIDNLKDWAISRSLWWGYRLPVWYKGEKVETIDENGQVQLKLRVRNELVDLDFTNKDLVRIQIENPNLQNPSFQEGGSTEGDDGRLKSRNLQSPRDSFLEGSIGSSRNSLERNTKIRSVYNPDNFPVDHSSGLPYNPKLVELASENRKNMNKPEAGIWSLLKGDKYGFDFHRQKIIGNYIVDFFCNELGLVVEIDGSSHDQKSEYDIKRDDYLEKQGLKVIHIWTDDIWNKLESVDIYLDNIIRERKINLQSLRDSFLEGSIETNSNLQDAEEPSVSQNSTASPKDSLNYKEASEEIWHQDEEVLDTWFSSGQWPYLQLSTWDMMKLYPIDCLVSGGDLLIKWDLIMMIMSLIKGFGTPFKNLYLTGMVLGKDGNKMSKSKKNGIPIESVVENYGIDSFRMNCIFKVAPFSNYQITEQTLKTFRNFNNKIWNAAKFVNEFCKVDSNEEISELHNPEDIEMKSKLEELKEHYISMMDNYKFWIISEELYLSFWNEFCDKYIEIVKKRVGNYDKERNEYIKYTTQDANEARSNINYIFKEYLKMLHPFVPFVTERIWKEMGEVEILTNNLI